jgi:hypothetical protein
VVENAILIGILLIFLLTYTVFVPGLRTLDEAQFVIGAHA